MICACVVHGFCRESWQCHGYFCGCLSHTAMFEDLQHNAEPEAVDLLGFKIKKKKLVLREWIKAGLSSYFRVLVLIY